MADKRIGELPEVYSVYDDTLLAAEQQGAAVKITAGQLREGITAGVHSFNGRSGEVSPQSGDYTAEQVGAVPQERRINGKPLTGDITLTAADIGVTGGGFVENGRIYPRGEADGKHAIWADFGNIFMKGGIKYGIHGADQFQV